MKQTKNLHWILLSIIVLYFIFPVSCARITAPTGGPKDTIPPTLVKSIPENNALNFKGKKIELTFSEMIQLNNPKEQIIITPTVGKDYEISIRKNTVILEIKNDLLDSTTYTFNFREAVQDVTERNPAQNLKLAISTGPYIDSLFLSGTIFNSLGQTPAKDATVAIYPKNDTFNIFEHQATYFTRTDKNGNFLFENLKPGAYNIFAMNDKNKNLKVDSRSEAYGFLKDSINLSDSVGGIIIGMVSLNAGPLKITNARPYNTYFNIRTTKNIKTFQMLSTDPNLRASFGEDQSNIRVYTAIPTPDSIQFKLKAVDSIGFTIDTVLYAKFNQREITPEVFKAGVTGSSIIADKGLISISMNFNKPVKTVTFDSIYFRIDSLTNIPFDQNDFHWDSTNNKLEIKKQADKALFAKPESSESLNRTTPQTNTSKQTNLNQLYIGKAAFISIENDSSSRITHPIQPLYPQDLGIIFFEIKTQEPNFIVQLLDKNLKILKAVSNKKKGSFEDLTPGNYLLRIVIDKNQNGRWDPGNFFQRIEPEPIKYYESEDEKTRDINLKANWDRDLLITY